MRTTTSTIRHLLWLLCLISAISWSETMLFEATYEGKYGGFTIETERRLVRLDDGSYRLQSKASNFVGSLTETSHFEKQGDLWRPLSYRYKRRVLGSRTTEAIAFDWDQGIARYTHSDKPERNSEHKLVPGILDPALYQLRMQRDLARGGEQLEYTFIKRDRIRQFVLERADAEELEVADGTYTAIKIQRADSDDTKQTYVWVIPELAYLLGKIVHFEEDGDAHQMLMTRYKYNKPLLEQFFGRSQAPDNRGRRDNP